MNKDKFAPAATIAVKLAHVVAIAITAVALFLIVLAFMSVPVFVRVAAMEILGLADPAAASLTLFMTAALYAGWAGIHRVILKQMYESIRSFTNS